MSGISIEMAGEQRPMVTQAQYERGREVLDALPPGIYIKCNDCRKWKRGGTFHFRNSPEDIRCEECG